MAVEIERKFLIADDSWRRDADQGRRIRQAYLSASASNSIRVRIVDEAHAWLTIKSGYRGIARDEFEYEIPLDDAIAMLELRRSSIVDKMRYRVRNGDLVWEVDVFAGANAGLVIAEIELDDEAAEPPRPTWLGTEITSESRYQNSMLASDPYENWGSSQ